MKPFPIELKPEQLRIIKVLRERGCTVELDEGWIEHSAPAMAKEDVRTAAQKQAWIVDHGLAEAFRAIGTGCTIEAVITKVEHAEPHQIRHSFKGDVFGRYVSDWATDATCKRAALEMLAILRAVRSGRTDPGWGQPYGEGPHYLTPDNGKVWMHRKGQRVRFFDVNGHQVGEEQANVAPAIVYAAIEGWIDPANPGFSALHNAEIRQEIEARGAKT